jgi:hypothetical protein
MFAGDWIKRDQIVRLGKEYATRADPRRRAKRGQYSSSAKRLGLELPAADQWQGDHRARAVGRDLQHRIARQLGRNQVGQPGIHPRLLESDPGVTRQDLQIGVAGRNEIIL